MPCFSGKQPENVVVQFNVTPPHESNKASGKSGSGLTNNKANGASGLTNKYDVKSVENNEKKADKTLERKLSKDDSKKEEKYMNDVLDNNNGKGMKNSNKDNIAIVDKMVVVDRLVLSLIFN